MNDERFDSTLLSANDRAAAYLLDKPLEEFTRQVQWLGWQATHRCYCVEMRDSARVPFLKVLRARLAKLQPAYADIPGRLTTTEMERKRRIKEALGLAICHIQTGSLSKQQVVAQLKATLAEIDATPNPLPPAA